MGKDGGSEDLDGGIEFGCDWNRCARPSPSERVLA
jgi:hypothetical protein